MIGSYFCSWSSKWVYSKQELDIKDVESDIIYISFAKPDCSYEKGSFVDTGLSFSSDFEVVAGACELIKDEKTIMLSVGGGTYHGWDKLNVDALISLADDLHCKGIDIDWEPENGSASSERMAEIINEFRDKYTGYLSFATAHVGAYGHGDFATSKPISMYTGVNYPGLLKSGSKLDWINVMAYDAGPTFDPLECYDAYQAIFPKKIYMGIELGDQAWGGVITTLEDVKKLHDHIKNKNADLFVWSWLKHGPFTYQEMLKAIQPPPPLEEPVKRPIEQVDTPEVQPEKPKDTTPAIPEIPPFTPTLPAIEPCEGKAIWSPGLPLSTGSLVFHKGITYKCRAAHTTFLGWEPDVAISLFIMVKDPLQTEWRAQMEYHTDEKVTHKGKQYTCVAGHVAQSDWEPGMVGLWK